MSEPEKPPNLFGVPVVELRIRYHQNTGQVEITGPLQNQLLALGLLELARVALLEQRLREGGADRQRVIPVTIKPVS